MTQNFLRLRTNPPSVLPPQGFVDLFFHGSTGAMRVVDEQGDVIPFEGAELNDTLDALSEVTLTPSTLLSVNSSGVPVALSYTATKNALSLNLVDNTSDADKPVSTLTQAALDLKQPLDATLTALAAQNWVDNAMPLGNAADGVSQLAFAANTFPGRSSTGNVVAKPIVDTSFTALAITVGSVGSFVTNGGALGTPSSGTLSGCSGLPISTGVSGLGTGVATLLATFSSANLATALTTKTGTGNNVFSDDPTFTTKIVSPIFKGTGTDVIIQDGAGNQAFRGINSTTWTDAAAGQYFQIGGSSVNVVFTAGSATNINRLGHFSEFFQISSGTRASAPIPVDRFELINSSNAKVFGVSNLGGVVIGAVAVGSLPTASANAYRQFVVTDSLAPVLGSAVAAGGSAKATVRSNGTDYIVTEIL